MYVFPQELRAKMNIGVDMRVLLIEIDLESYLNNLAHKLVSRIYQTPPEVTRKNQEERAAASASRIR